MGAVAYAAGVDEAYVGLAHHAEGFRHQAAELLSGCERRRQFAEGALEVGVGAEEL